MIENCSDYYDEVDTPNKVANVEDNIMQYRLVECCTNCKHWKYGEYFGEVGRTPDKCTKWNVSPVFDGGKCHNGFEWNDYKIKAYNLTIEKIKEG